MRFRIVLRVFCLNGVGGSIIHVVFIKREILPEGYRETIWNVVPCEVFHVSVDFP